MKTIPISEATLHAVLQYLAGCPYGQVEPMMIALKNEIGAAQMAEKAKAETPANEKTEVKIEKKR